MQSDLAAAALFVEQGFCPACSGRLRGTKGHVWGSTRTVVRSHGECFKDQLCWVLFDDNRLMMQTHDHVNNGPLELPEDVFMVGQVPGDGRTG